MGVGHGVLAAGGDDGIDFFRDAEKDQPAAAADRRLGGKDRRAGVAHRAAVNVYLAEGPLVPVRSPFGQQAAHQFVCNRFQVNHLLNKDKRPPAVSQRREVAFFYHGSLRTRSSVLIKSSRSKGLQTNAFAPIFDASWTVSS